MYLKFAIIFLNNLNWKRISWAVVEKKVFCFQNKLYKLSKLVNLRKLLIYQTIFLNSFSVRIYTVKNIMKNLSDVFNNYFFFNSFDKFVLSLNLRNYKHFSFNTITFIQLSKNSGMSDDFTFFELYDFCLDFLLSISIAPIIEAQSDRCQYKIFPSNNYGDFFFRLKDSLSNKFNLKFFYFNEIDLLSFFHANCNFFLLKNFFIRKNSLIGWVDFTYKSFLKGYFLSLFSILFDFLFFGLEIFFLNKLLYSYNFKDFKKILTFRVFNKFLFFSTNLKILSVLNVNLFRFTLNSGLVVIPQKIYFDSLYSGFFFDDWYFLRDSASVLFCKPNYLNIKLYKCKLKTVIKKSSQISPYYLIKLLNFQINEWSTEIGFFASSSTLALSLDFYLYKLLWKWSKRLHPRRPNGWIFEKYWKNISGSFKFFSLNPLTGYVYFLASHLISNKFSKVLPSSISMFDFRDRKKLSSDLFKKIRNKLFGVYGVLFDIQKGICPCCNQFFNNYNLKSFRVLNLSSLTNVRNNFSYSSHLILIHRSCTLNGIKLLI